MCPRCGSEDPQERRARASRAPYQPQWRFVHMAYEYDRIEREEGSGAFLMGLLAGTVLGAGLGMLFAPKAGSELRSQLSQQANKLRDT
ncbi:MAG: YtxH domain-containing protein, partial [Vicinamibacterales bacterium]